MELLVATGIGVMAAAGTYLILRLRSFAVVLGTAMLSYAINLFLFASGRLQVNGAPILGGGAVTYSDPLPQALVLTAIVISFGMTAVVVLLALGAFIEGGDDRIDMPRADRLPPAGGEDFDDGLDDDGPIDVTAGTTPDAAFEISGGKA